MRLSIRMNARNSLDSQAGFSMIEMLMTAFILAIGILGLSMLQVMSLKASRGSRSLTTAVQVAEKVMDQVELEGRLTWLDSTITEKLTPTDLSVTLQYVNKVAPVTNTFNIKGQAIPASSTDPADLVTVFTTTTTRLGTVVDGGGVQVSVPGSTARLEMHDFTVVVNFADEVNPTTNTKINRSVTLTRRVLHG